LARYDKRDTIRVFRERLAGLIERGGGKQSDFARKIGVDRSTLSQLLSGPDSRLPRADTIAAIAINNQVSADWLLGLSQEDQADEAIVGPPLEIAAGAADPANERLQAWHAEAAGYKVRYTPTTLPDLLKTEEVNRYEYEGSQGMSVEFATRSARENLAYSRRPETDMEVCSSVQSLEAFARGEGLWRDLAPDLRRDQLRTIADLCEELYPTLRWFLFDARKRYGAPLTIFGPIRAVLYTGEVYFVFNGTDHIRILTEHFDSLIRSAIVQPPEVPGLARDLIETVTE